MLPVRSIFFSSGISTHMMRVLISTSLKKSVEILHSFSFSAIDDFSVSYIYYTAAKFHNIRPEAEMIQRIIKYVSGSIRGMANIFNKGEFIWNKEKTF